MGIEKKLVSARLDDELIKKLKEMGEKENRSLSNVIETILKKYFENQEKENNN